MLVSQLAHELKNYTLYKTFANYYSVEGISDLERYFNLRAEEELTHSEWIYTYLSEADCQFTYPVININEEEIKELSDPFKLTVAREIETTQLIYKIYEQALSEKDYMTASWLLKELIKEQTEEENISRVAETIFASASDLYVRAYQILSLLN